MSGPIVFISHFKVKEGKLDSLKQFARAMTEHIQSDKPGTLAFLQYLNEEGTEQSVVHVFTDAQAMDRHGKGVAKRSNAALEFIELTRREVYGMPNDDSLATLRPLEGSGIPLTFMPQSMGGNIRLKPA